MKSNENTKKILLLDNIRSAHNVGSILRIADTVGIEEVVLTGITALPIDRFGRANNEIIKTSLGAEKSLKWSYVEYPIEYVLDKQKNGFKLIVLEQSKNSLDYKSIKLDYPFIFVVGNEVEGVNREILEEADEVIEIPMLGKKESLNVAVATAVALFRILNV